MASTTVPDVSVVEEPSIRRPAQVDLGKAARWGLLSGLAATLVSAIGLVASFQARMIISPVLSFGYLALAAVPTVFGYMAGRPPPVLEGFEEAPKGARNLLAGLIVGSGTWAVLAVFVAFFSTANLRSIFINVNPVLLEQVLLFRRETATGLAFLALMVVGCAVAGAAFNFIPERFRRPALATIIWVVNFGLLTDLIGQFFTGLGLGFVDDFLYPPGGGLGIVSAVVVGVVVFAAYTAVERRRNTVRERFESASTNQRRVWAVAGAAVVAVLLAVLPQLLGRRLSEVLTIVGIYLLLALGLNVVVGYAGLLDLGYVAFFAVGAYVTAVLTSPNSQAFSPELAFWLAVPVVVLAAALAGIVVGTPVLRMRGDYLAIVTLGFGEIARILFLSDWLEPVFGGAQGITGIDSITVGGRSLDLPQEQYYPIVIFVIIAAYVSWTLRESRIGRAWMAIREDEPVAEALGINIVTAKLSAFVVGAVLASIGGAIFATKVHIALPSSFGIIVSIIVLVIIIVGGMGSLPGVAVGALVIMGLPELLREFEEYRFLLYGGLLIFMMVTKPEGLVPSQQRAAELHQEEMMQDAWLSHEAEQDGKEIPASSPEADPDKTT